MLLKGVKIDIVVSAAVHLGELELGALGAHMVDVHQLAVQFGIAALYAVGYGVSRVYGGQAGYASLYRLAPYFNAVPAGQAAFGAGGDKIVYFAALYKGEGVDVCFRVSC